MFNNGNNVAEISDVIKEYPHMLQIIIYHKPYSVYKKQTQIKQTTKKDKKLANLERSVRRSRVTIKDLILCNKYDLWCTFTFDPKKVDTLNNHALAQLRIQTWLKNQKIRSPELKYLIIPEQHKSGRYHFHALLKNYNGNLKDSKLKTKSGQIIYNATGYRLGFTQFVKIENKDVDEYAKIANYISKYVTKDTPLIHGKRRFLASTHQKRPNVAVNALDKIPELSKKIIDYKPDLINANFELQTHPIYDKIPEKIQDMYLQDEIDKIKYKAKTYAKSLYTEILFDKFNNNTVLNPPNHNYNITDPINHKTQPLIEH